MNDITLTATMDAETLARLKKDKRNARRRELRAMKKAAAAKVETLKVSVGPRSNSVRVKSASAPSKKDSARTIYLEVTLSGGGRKEGIAMMKSELNMSNAAASTYWQNIKSGKTGWAV